MGATRSPTSTSIKILASLINSSTSQLLHAFRRALHILNLLGMLAKVRLRAKVLLLQRWGRSLLCYGVYGIGNARSAGAAWCNRVCPFSLWEHL